MHILKGTLMHYSWGTVDAIPALLGMEPDGRPYAEYWLGAHPSSPSAIEHAALDVIVENIPEVLGEGPFQAFGPRLSFLMKILSAQQALSIQTHPSREQAVEGYAREDALDIPLTSPRRTYKDTWPKPERLIALSTFDALAGFREPEKTAALFAAIGVADELESVIGPLTLRRGSAALEEVFLDVLSLDGPRRDLVDVVCAAAVEHLDDEGEVGDFARTAVSIDEHYPSDPGILAALMLNHLVLQPGDSIFMHPGRLHAYISGTAIEVMANSDNVIRGGLTSKHIDVPELVRVVDFSPSCPEIEQGEDLGRGIRKYGCWCPEFQVWRVQPEGDQVELPGGYSARIGLNLSGSLVVSRGQEHLTLERGEAVFVRASDSPLTLTGHGDLFLCASGEGVAAIKVAAATVGTAAAGNTAAAGGTAAAATPADTAETTPSGQTATS